MIRALPVLFVLTGCEVTVTIKSSPPSPQPIQVEATTPRIERTVTHGPVPDNWTQYGVDSATGMKKIERIRQ